MISTALDAAAEQTGVEQIRREVRESGVKTVMSALLLLSFAGYVLANVTELWVELPRLTVVLAALWIVMAMFRALQDQRPGWANFVWGAGLLAVVSLAVALFGRPELAPFYVLVPLLVSLVAEWRWAFATQIALVGLLATLGPRMGLGGITSLASVTVLIIGALALVLGWVFARELYLTAEWGMGHYYLARQQVQELREQRVDLLRAQQDRNLANIELARLTDRLAMMTQLAEEARHAKEEFVARVSHELRTPLNMIVGFSEVIMRSPEAYGADLPGMLLADVAAIYRNSLHLSELVDDVLDLSQVDAGRVALTRSWIRAGELIHSAVEAVRGLFERKGLSVEVEIADENLPLFVDATRIRQVIINLLGNAGRFTEQGGVVVSLQRSGDEAIIAVRDTGPGIPAEEQQRLFEPFYQAQSLLRGHKGGTGLGLSISKRFVEMHGGRIWLESVVGQGSTFSFSLPLILRTAAAERLGADARRWFSPYQEYDPRDRPADLPDVPPGPRYVVLEREENLARVVRRYVQAAEVVGVADADAVHAELARTPANALLVNAPPHDLHAWLRGPLASLPYVTPLLSCWLPGRDEAARRLHVREYLLKPVTREQLEQAIQDVGVHVRRILLVDDESDVLRLFVRMLSTGDQRYQVNQALTARRALQLMRERSPDLVLLDLLMPDMDGFELLRQKSDDPSIRDIPVVVVSSRNPEGEARVCPVLEVRQGDGLSTLELLRCIEGLTQILAPTAGPTRPKRLETAGAKQA
ncbi:MAG: response regulator [Anaerolineae bacterium]|nr:response regulator [Anaerolineae bacterium]